MWAIMFYFIFIILFSFVLLRELNAKDNLKRERTKESGNNK